MRPELCLLDDQEVLLATDLYGISLLGSEIVR